MNTNDEWLRYVKITNDMDRWSEARSQLGYSDRVAVFTEVGPAVVPTATVQAVGATVSLLVSLTGIQRPQVRWFRPETSAEQDYRTVHGLADLGQFEAVDNLAGRAIRDEHTVWVRADLALPDAMRTAAHECRHLAQDVPTDVGGYVTNERDARAYEAAFSAAYLSRN